METYYLRLRISLYSKYIMTYPSTRNRMKKSDNRTYKNAKRTRRVSRSKKQNNKSRRKIRGGGSKTVINKSLFDNFDNFDNFNNNLTHIITKQYKLFNVSSRYIGDTYWVYSKDNENKIVEQKYSSVPTTDGHGINDLFEICEANRMTNEQFKNVFQRDSTKSFAKIESYHSAWAYNRKGALLLFLTGPKFLLNAEINDTLQTAIDNERLVNVEDIIIYQPNAKKNKEIVDIAANTVRRQFDNKYNLERNSDSASNFGLTPEELDNVMNSNDDPSDSRTSLSSND